MKESSMKRAIFILVFFINLTAYTQEADDYSDDEFFDIGVAGELTVFGERPGEYDSKSIDAYVINQLNGSLSDRKQFIEKDFLEESGFRRTGNVRYRKTNGFEKTASILSRIGNMFSLGIISPEPFSETELERLPKGEYYKFEAVFVRSNFLNVTPEILTLIELEYMLQIEFRGGLLMQDNKNYYTNENIDKFERLINRLPDFPESVYQVKNRYLNESLKIKTVLERHKNPDENYLMVLQNLSDIFNMNRNR
jgi:hypothetical protein